MEVAKIWTCPYSLKVQACPPRDHRPAILSKVLGQKITQCWDSPVAKFLLDSRSSYDPLGYFLLQSVPNNYGMIFHINYFNMYKKKRPCYLKTKSKEYHTPMIVRHGFVFLICTYPTFKKYDRKCCGQTVPTIWKFNVKLLPFWIKHYASLVFVLHCHFYYLI